MHLHPAIHPVLLAALLVLAACQADTGTSEPAGLQTGFWHARITLPGGDIDTGIELTGSPGAYKASLINGQERVAIDEVAFADGELLLRFPVFNNEIRARLVEGRLEGELRITGQGGAVQAMPFAATHGTGRTVAAPAAGEPDLSGRWAAAFVEPDGSVTPAVGEFSQRGTRLFGTFLNPNGDHRYLAGYVRGNEFRLSTFDGAHAFLFTGTLDGGEIRDADFWSGTSWHQEWSARRDPGVALPDAWSRTFLKPGHDRFGFEFPDQDGTPVSLADERYRGKVVVVTLAGTWCPNCHDEARFLAALYRQYRDRGLEVVALMYEHFDDHAVAAGQVREFRRKFGIEYRTLIAGISSKTEASRTLPSLNAVLAFPTTIFIDRSGRVRRIHTGFSGPGTGEHFRRQTAEMTALIEELLAEPAGLIESQPADAA